MELPIIIKRRYRKRLLNFSIDVLSIALILWIFLLLTLQLPYVQNAIKDKVLHWVNQHFHQNIQVEQIHFDIPGGITLNFKIYDHHDQLLSSTDLLSLSPENWIDIWLEKNLKIGALTADQFKLHIKTYPGEEQSNLDQFISKFKSDQSSGKPFNFFLRKLEVNGMELTLELPDLNAKANIDKLLVRMDSIDLENNYFQFRSVLLDRPIVSLHRNTLQKQQSPSPSSASESIQEDSCVYGPAFNFAFINCTNGKFDFSSTQESDSLKFESINFSSTFSYFSTDLNRIEFLTFNAKGKDNFRIKDLHVSGFNQTLNELSLNKLALKTSHSTLEVTGKLISLYSPLHRKLYDDWSTQLHIVKAELFSDDIAVFDKKGQLTKFLSEGLHVPLTFTGRISGGPNALLFNKMELNYGNAFTFSGGGQLRHLMTSKEPLLNFKIKAAKLDSRFGYNLLNNPSIPKSYLQLGNIRFSGNFDGYLSDFVAYGTFNTNLGTIHSDLKLALKKDISQARYSGSVSSEQFALGKLLNAPWLGKITAYAAITEGKGLTKESINANLSATIESAEINGKNILNTSFSGILKSDALNGELIFEDPNIQASLKGNIGLGGKSPNVHIRCEIQKMELGVISKSLTGRRLKASIQTDFSTNQNGDIEGLVKGANIHYEDSLSAIEIKELVLSQKYQQGLRHLSLESDVLDSKIIGKFNESTVLNDLLYYLNRRYKNFLSNITPLSNQDPNEIWLNANIYIQDIEKLNAILHLPLQAKYLDLDLVVDSRKDIFELRSNRFDLLYKKFLVSKLSINLNSLNQLKSGITFDYIQENENKRVGNGKLLISLDGESGNIHTQLFDASNKRLLCNMVNDFAITNKSFDISLRNENLYFNDDKWVVNTDNKIHIEKNTFSIQQFELSDSTHFLSVRDYDGQGFVLSAEGFSMQLVNDLLKSETVHFGGIFGTEVTIPSIKNLKDARGTLSIVDFTLNKSHFGLLKINFSAPDINLPWKLNLINKYQNQELKGIGTINIPNGKDDYLFHPFEFDMNFDLINFPLSFIENFIDAVSNSKGGGDGKIRFYSERNKLNIEGNVIIEDATTFINYLGVPLQIRNQPIRFEKRSISCDSITVQDKLGNDVKVFGKVYHHNLKDWNMDIGVSSKKALLLETTKDNKEAYYGYGIGQVDARFTGPVSQLQMDVSLISSKGTKLYIPMTSSNVAERADFVQFVNRNAGKIDIQRPARTNTTLTGINVNMQLSLTEDAEVSVIFDELTGDILKGKGRGNLLIKSLRNGLFNVNGDYEIEQGQYLFTLYNFVNKPFTLSRGGVATWTGDPLNANINIEAVYEGLQAAPYLLLQEYLGENADLIEEAKRRTAVKLKMLLTGSLLKPNISFDLELPDLTGNLRNYAENKIQYLKLNQDQFNQQIFGLLVLGTFLNNTNPWEGGLIGNLGTTTINTMSEMLSNQFSLFVTNLLNNAFDDVNFISGIDFNIGYDIDNTKVAGTNLNESEVVFSLKHRLWNDQWIVTLGGNYKSNSQILGNSYFNPESVIEWNTPVQGLKMRVYYRGDESIEGIKHKVGAGVSIRKEFDHIFNGPKK